MLKMTEKTLNTYLEDNYRLQLVQIENGSFYYEVRANRKLMIRTDFLPEAIAHFGSYIQNSLTQLSFNYD